MILALVILEALGLLLVAGAFFYRVWREWVQHGLSGASYMSLSMIASGCIIGAVARIAAAGWLGLIVALPYAIAAGGALTCIAWKLHARFQLLAHRPHSHGHGDY